MASGRVSHVLGWPGGLHPPGQRLPAHSRERALPSLLPRPGWLSPPTAALQLSWSRPLEPWPVPGEIPSACVPTLDTAQGLGARGIRGGPGVCGEGDKQQWLRESEPRLGGRSGLSMG